MIGTALHIKQNINARLSLRSYQQEAIASFKKRFKNRGDQPFHGLFHMATGSGKTLVMAALLLDLYTEGYTKFIFLVNSTSILSKTRANFLDQHASKYLFHTSGIEIGGATVHIREVSRFDEQSNTIQLYFTTVQGLHSRLLYPRENDVTLTELSNQKIVILSDEAHHLNVSTKSKKSSEATVNWETSVLNLFKTNKNNVLLEFTATAELSNEDVARKYKDIIVYDYPLKRYRQEGYAKNVHVYQSNDNPIFRAITACILSIWREAIFKKNGVSAKPVVLLKSSTIAKSKSNYDQFFATIMGYTSTDIANHIASILEQFPEYAAHLNDLSDYDALLFTLKNSFSPANSMIVDSSQDAEEHQLHLNNLEDESNPYRLIFAVDKLNEGWDVLNLFDIVRMYDTVSISNKRLSNATISEIQLIGRGARYYPFEIADNLNKTKRKFDDQKDHPLYLCETLIYHAPHHVSYIDELHQAMIVTGLIADDDEEAVSKNENDRSWYGWDAIPHELRTIQVGSQNDNKEAILINELWHQGILMQAMDRFHFYRFDQLKKLFPSLLGKREWLNADNYLGSVKVILEKEDMCQPKDQMERCSQALQILAEGLNKIN